MANEVKKETKKFKRPPLNKIVNVFIGIVAIFLFILIIFFGFSQTKTFRNFLRDQITEQVSQSINGNLSIERIEGSVLSSLILHNSTLITKGDTLLKAQEITIKTSPIHIFLKRILIRDISIRNAYLNLKEYQNGEWNYSNLAKQDSVVEEMVDTDTSKRSFPFSIQINNLDFQPEIKEVKGGLGIKATIAAGTESDCAWEIIVDGKLVLFGGVKTGTIDINTEETVKQGFSLALGNVNVIVKAGTLEEEYTAFAIGPFYLNVKEV